MARLYGKYSVHRIRPMRDSPQPTSVGHSVDLDDVGSPFVLIPRKDPAALTALKCYAENCEPELADSIKQWIERIEKAGKVLGTQGMRNTPFCKVKGVK